MKKRIVAMILAVSMFSMTACGGSASENTSTAEAASEETMVEAESSEDSIPGAPLEVDKGLFNVEITVPSEYLGEDVTQEALDQEAKEKGYKQVILNEDGSATYVMSKSQHDEAMEELRSTLDEEFAAMVGSEDYPNFTDITHNDEYTKFTVTTTSTELSIMESVSVLVFYMAGGMYNAFNGTPADNINVEFINADSGEVVVNANSSEMGTAE